VEENLYGILRAGFADCLDEPCLCPPGQAARSYRELDELSARYAGLLGELGLQAGDRAVAQVEKSTEAVALYMACLRTGVIYVPLNTAYTPAELEHFLGDAQPRLFVATPAAAAAVEPAAQQADVPHLLSLDSQGGGSLAQRARSVVPRETLEPRAASDIAAIVYTSGTTGRSKGAMLSIGNLASNARTLYSLWGWRADDVLLHALPVFHVHGLFVALHCALLGGHRVLFHTRFDAPVVRGALAEATVMMGVPTFYTRLLEEPGFSKADCARMRLFISGSAPLLAASMEAFAQRTGHRILERYGMTEAGMITSNPLDGERIAGSVGYPLPGVTVRVRSDAGQDCPVNEVGQVEIRGPNVFAGYWRQPEKTRAEFTADGFFRTGDLGSLSADQRLTLVGRSRDLIISGGYNIYPKEIESALDALDGVAESAVIGVPHADLGEGVVAIIVAAGEPPEEAALHDALTGRLAKFKHPRRYVVLNSLPRNAMGKVEKQRLRERYTELLSQDPSFI
jgi:malonyl-CoA/methylmalonyl-CoA synthetase